jgi:hypothetical protein
MRSSCTSALAALRQYIVHIRGTIALELALDEKQRASGSLPVLKLQLSNDTRWSSVYMMLKRCGVALFHYCCA